MKRLTFIVVVIAMTVPAFGLTVTPRPGDRVGTAAHAVAHQAALRIAGR